MTEAASGVLQGSVFGHIPFVIYANDLTDNLKIDHLLHADDVKLIASGKQVPDHQRSLVASSKWSEDWGLILNSSKVSTSPLGYFQSCYILLNIPHLTQRTAHSDGQLCS